MTKEEFIKKWENYDIVCSKCDESTEIIKCIFCQQCITYKIKYEQKEKQYIFCFLTENNLYGRNSFISSLSFIKSYYQDFKDTISCKEDHALLKRIESFLNLNQLTLYFYKGKQVQKVECSNLPLSIWKDEKYHYLVDDSLSVRYILDEKGNQMDVEEGTFIEKVRFFL